MSPTFAAFGTEKRPTFAGVMVPSVLEENFWPELEKVLLSMAERRSTSPVAERFTRSESARPDSDVRHWVCEMPLERPQWCSLQVWWVLAQWVKPKNTNVQ